MNFQLQGLEAVVALAIITSPIWIAFGMGLWIGHLFTCL